jgi:hypothetical protein
MYNSDAGRDALVTVPVVFRLAEKLPYGALSLSSVAAVPELELNVQPITEVVST